MSAKSIKLVGAALLVLLLVTGLRAQTPHVVSVLPESNELGVAISASITAAFDTDLDVSTLDANSMVVMGLRTGIYPGAIAYDAPTHTVEFSPSADFRPGELVTVVLTTNIESSGGFPLASPVVWSFTTAVEDDPGSLAPQSIYDCGSGPYGICAADLDGDGVTDLVTANETSDDLTLLANSGDGVFSVAATYAAGDGPWAVCAGDFDFDGDLDLAAAAKASSQIIVLKNQGGFVFAIDSVYPGGSGCQSIKAADFNGDGVADLATANVSGGGVSVLLNLGDGTFGPTITYSSGGNPFDLDIADLDGDHDIDIVCVNSAAGRAGVLTNNGVGVFALDSLYAAGSGPWSVCAADLNGDRHVDLAVANFVSNNVSVLINNGSGEFLDAVHYSTRIRPFAVEAGDFDADNDLDLVVVNFNSDTLSYLENQGDGTYYPQLLFPTGSGPVALAVLDVDGDDDMDVAVANNKASSVSILKNQLSLVPNPLEFNLSAYGGGPNPPGQAFTITSNGYELDYTITSDVGWLTVADPVAQTPITTAVQIDVDGLVVGEYDGLLTLSSSDPLTSPITVPVHLAVLNWPPAWTISEHNRGRITLAVPNNGTLGTGFSSGSIDHCTGLPIAFGSEFPKDSYVGYLFGGALWVGAVVGQDTLVSVGADGWSAGAEMYTNEELICRSTIDTLSSEHALAVSEQDIIAVYTDTSLEGIAPDYFGRPHVPLHVELTQSSYAWSYPYAEDFVLMNYDIRNIGGSPLNDFYVGLYIDGDVYSSIGAPQGYSDDISGFLETSSMNYGGCDRMDTVNLAWIADNDGDLYSAYPASGVVATSVLRTPNEDAVFSFNWWLSNGNPELDFGPRMKPTAEDPWRDFNTGGIGTPEGDVNKYYIMRHPERDYDQVFTASIPPDDPVWMYPNQAQAVDFSNGFDTRYLLSFGPFDVFPGQTLPLTVAWLAGADLHTDPGNIANLPDQPDLFYSNLDFSDLVLNAHWASWIYDNPGVDTDSDGYAGSFIVCNEDTIYYCGDGVPDYRAASPPPAPVFWAEPQPTGLRVRFNGLVSQTTRDVFSRAFDFEGYRVCLSPDATPQSLAQVASYDVEDYLKYIWNNSPPRWESRDAPFGIRELRCLYGASCDDMSFDPLQYTPQSPYVHPNFPESLFYFVKMGDNASQFCVTTDICKIYPDQPAPITLDPDSAQPNELTPDGYFKYFEYELVIEDLLPDNCYGVNVTAFDYGSPASGVPPLESNRYDAMQVVCLGEPDYICGDVDGTAALPIDISDLLYLIDYMFQQGPAPTIPATADVYDCNSQIDISDLVYLINFMFLEGPAPCDSCGQILAAGSGGNVNRGVCNIVSSTPSSTGHSLAIDGDFDVAVAGFQQEFWYDGATVVIDSVVRHSDNSEVDLYWRADDGRLTLGLIDIYGKHNIMKGKSQLATIYYHTSGGDPDGQNGLTHMSTKAAERGARPLQMNVNTGKSEPNLPTTFALHQNYPNPFNSHTVIRYDLPATSRVEIVIYDILGQRVRLLATGEQPAGFHQVTWDGTDAHGKAVASGVYFYRIKAEGFTESKKMVLLK